MRILLLTILALAATAAIATAVKAYAEESAVRGFYTGSELLVRCESANLPNTLFCMAYIAAISDHISNDKFTFPNASSRYWNFNHVCEPEGSSIVQFEKVWIKWANEHPEQLHRAASSLVTQALAEAFPCP